MSKAIWVERTGKGTFVGKTSDGAEVKIGKAEGMFSPGDLLKIALAGCNIMSGDARLAAALGDDYDATVGISSDYDKESNRYTHMDVEIVADTTQLSDEAREQLHRRTRSAIDRQCTVGHTLTQGMDSDLQFSSDF